MFRTSFVAAALALQLLASPAVPAASIADAGTPANPLEIVEFYNATLDHYFVTGLPAEIAALDDGAMPGWARTGYHFYGWSSPAPYAFPVCRFYGRPEAGLDSHFYSGSLDECAAVEAKFASSWELESSDVFDIRMPDLTTGACPSATVPIYRIFNNRTDANHRYTTDAGVRAAMIAAGGIPEGYGSDGVAFCSEIPPLSISILVSALSDDVFSFSSSIAAAAGAAVMSYGWSFGDGATDTVATVTHQYVAPGSYPVVLSVTDNQGGVVSASTIVNVAANGMPGTGVSPSNAADFIARRSAPGVVRWFDFDDPAKLAGPLTPSGYTAYGIDKGNSTTPTVDTTVAASGAGSLRFDIPSQSGANAAGDFRANFSDDLSVQFGENAEFYVQWRQRFNDAMVNTVFAGAESIKMMGVTAGDTPALGFSSCEGIGVIVTTYYNRRFPISYDSCTGSASHPAYSGFYEHSGSDYLLENATLPVCSYQQNYSVQPVTSGAPGCFTWFANEWMTFEMRVKTGARNNSTNEFDDSEYQLWGAREGGAPVLLIDWHAGIGGYFPLTANDPTTKAQESFGKVYLLPYMTGKDAMQTYPLAQTWYDELIISRAPIAFPGGKALTVPRAVSIATASPPLTPGTLPVWRRGLPVGKFSPIPGTGNMTGYTWPDPNPTNTTGVVNAWQGYARNGTRWFSAAASGHGEWQNPVLNIDLAAAAPKWTVLDPGSTFSDVVNNAPYYKDGRPVSRHTYYTTQFVRGAMARDGIDRVMLFTSYAAYGIDTGPGSFSGGPQVDGFRLADNHWDAPGTFASIPSYSILASVASDPRTDDVYVGGGYSVYKWTAKTAAWSKLADSQTAPGLLSWDQYDPSLVDPKRNALVGIHDGKPYGANPGMVRFQRVDLATGALATVMTARLPQSAQSGAAVVYDQDSDRYVLLTASGAVYTIDPDTAIATLLTMGTVPTSGVWGRAAYFPELGGIAYLPSFTSPILFLPTR